MSTATYDWADEQYLMMGLDPAQAKFVGVKNPMNFRLGARTIIVHPMMETDAVLNLTQVASTVQAMRSTQTSRKTVFLSRRQDQPLR